MANEKLKSKIQNIVKNLYSQGTFSVSSSETEVISSEETFPILAKFPELKKVIIDLLTKQYENFILDIQWVAPRPTTFKIVLNNNQSFYLMYDKTSWVAQVEGKRYYLLNLPEEERAAEAISRILKYGFTVNKTQEPPTPEETPVETPTETPAEETPEETPPTV